MAKESKHDLRRRRWESRRAEMEGKWGPREEAIVWIQPYSDCEDLNSELKKEREWRESEECECVKRERERMKRRREKEQKEKERKERARERRKGEGTYSMTEE